MPLGAAVGFGLVTPGQGAHTQPLSPFYLWRKGGIPYPRMGWDSAVVHAWKGKGSTDPSSIGSGRTPFAATLALCVRASRSRGELRMATVLSTPPCILQVLLASTFGSLIPAASSARGFRSSFAAKQCPNGGDPETLGEIFCTSVGPAALPASVRGRDGMGTPGWPCRVGSAAPLLRVAIGAASR